MRAEQAASDRGHIGLLFPDLPRLGRGRTYPRQDLVSPVPRPDWGPQLPLAPGVPRGWKRDPHLTADLVSWASILRWREGEVSYADLAMVFEATLGRALPAPGARPAHDCASAAGTSSCPTASRSGAPAAPVGGRLLPTEETPRCHSPIALGGCTCLGLRGRPYFAARGEMMRMFEGLAPHCVTHWQRRLSRPLHAAPMPDFLERFLQDQQARPPFDRTSGHNDGRAASRRCRHNSPPPRERRRQQPCRGSSPLGVG